MEVLGHVKGLSGGGFFALQLILAALALIQASFQGFYLNP
jgi:hypothetical protein